MTAPPRAGALRGSRELKGEPAGRKRHRVMRRTTREAAARIRYLCRSACMALQHVLRYRQRATSLCGRTSASHYLYSLPRHTGAGRAYL